MFGEPSGFGTAAENDAQLSLSYCSADDHRRTTFSCIRPGQSSRRGDTRQRAAGSSRETVDQTAILGPRRCDMDGWMIALGYIAWVVFAIWAGYRLILRCERRRR